MARTECWKIFTTRIWPELSTEKANACPSLISDDDQYTLPALKPPMAALFRYNLVNSSIDGKYQSEYPPEFKS